ncbi:hypothetical protein KMT30_17530 [Streptomyces sp. IBSBF 2953]|nr:hypothetical protein [Streptomyces hayashii]
MTPCPTEPVRRALRLQGRWPDGTGPHRTDDRRRHTDFDLPMNRWMSGRAAPAPGFEEPTDRGLARPPSCTALLTVPSDLRPGRSVTPTGCAG